MIKKYVVLKVSGYGDFASAFVRFTSDSKDDAFDYARLMERNETDSKTTYQVFESCTR